MVRLSEYESIQTLLVKPGHFVPGAQKMYLSVGAGMHKANERHCLPIMHSELWWLRGFSCSGLFDTHGAGGAPLKEARNLSLFPQGRLSECFYFLQAAHWATALTGSSQMVEVSRCLSYLQSIIYLRNICAMQKGVHHIYLCKLMLRNVCKAVPCPWMTRIWGWTGGIACSLNGSPCPTREQR